MWMIDVRNTYKSLMFTGCTQRTKYQTKEQRDAGVPVEYEAGKWQAEVGVSYLDPRQRSEFIVVGLLADTNPAAGIPENSQVEFDGLEVSVMSASVRTDKNGMAQPSGGRPFYTARSIRAAGASVNGKYGKQEAAA